MFPRCSAFFAVVAVLVGGTLSVQAEETAPSLFPGTTVLYAEVSRPPELIGTILDHPLRRRVEALDDYQQALRKKEARQLKAAVAIIEAQLEMDWPEILSSLTEGGVYAAVDAQTKGIAVLIRSADAGTLEKVRDALLEMIRGDAQRKGQDDPIKSDMYRGIQVFGSEKAKLATFGPWLLVTNQSALGRAILDQQLDGAENSLSHGPRFLAARELVPPRVSAWAFADIESLRDAGAVKELFQGRAADNPVAELLVGGVLSNLQQTPLVVGWLDVQREQVRVRLASPHDPARVDEAHEYYFGVGGTGVAPPLAALDGAVLAISTYRDIAGMWLHAGDLFSEGVNDNLAQADSTLTTLFAGKEFGEEILGALQPQIQIIVRRQDFADDLPQPAIKLPAVATVFRLRDADAMRDELRRTFQSLIGFLNIAGAQNGQPQLDFQFSQQGERQLVTASYVPEAREKESHQARINFNFSPSVGFVEQRFVLSSAAALARELSQQAAPDVDQDRANTRARLDVAALRDVLQDNRSQLIAQNMLKEGNSKQEAEKQIDSLLHLMGWARDVTLRLGATDKLLQVDLQLNLADSP